MFSHRVSKLRSEWRISKILGIDIRMNFEIENFDEKFWWKRVKIRKFQDHTFHVQSHLIISYFENLDKVTCKNGGLHWSISKADFHQYDHGFFRGKCDPVKSRDGTHYEMTIPFGSCGLKRKVWWSNNTIHYMVSTLNEFYFGWLNIKEIEASFPISIKLFFNPQFWNKSKFILIRMSTKDWVDFSPTQILHLVKFGTSKFKVRLKMLLRVEKCH